MKRITFSLLVILLLALPTLFVGAAEEPTSPDPDEETVGITILEDGESIVDLFENDIYARIYGFNATAGDRVTVSMVPTGDTGLDTFLVILGPYGEVIAVDDDSGPIPLSSEIRDVELIDSGGYFILATTFVGVDTLGEETAEDGSGFELSIDGITQPVDMPDFDPETIGYYGGDAQFGEAAEGYSNPAEPVFYVTLPAQAGDVIDIELASDDFDTVLHVFGQNGDRIAVNDDDPTGGSTNSAIYDLELPVSGEYLIFATNLFFYNVNQEYDPESSLNYTGGDFELFISNPR